jgi:hypothetical protein
LHLFLSSLSLSLSLSLLLSLISSASWHTVDLLYDINYFGR